MKYGKLITIPLIALALACGKDTDTSKEDKALSAPEKVTLHSSTEDSFTFQWSAVQNATGYDWRLTNPDGSVALEGVSQQRNATVSPVEQGISYSFKVRAKADGYTTSPWSAAITAYMEKTGDPDPDPGTDDPVDDSLYEQFLIPESEEDGVARAFPGAQGGGMYATGGRGGKILHVTTLEDNNSEGSLRWACTQNYARIIVFDVAGVIELKSQLQINRDNCTIAGQTAPGDGICLKNYTFRISASNVIVRFIRCRMGDELKTEDDAIQVMSHDDDKYSNIIIDHCSVSWSTDECASFYGMKDFTFSWNIVSESLRVSIHNKGTHGYGGIWGGNNATYHHNLLAHHDSRNPRIDHDYVSTQRGPVSIVNNVVYNWRGNTCYGGESSVGGYRKYNFVGNCYKPGPATPSNHMWLLDPTTSCSNCSGVSGAGSIEPGHFYMTGNTLYGKSSVTSDNWTGTTANSTVVSKIKSSEVFSAGSYPVALQTADECFESVLSYAGACRKRDAIDSRIADETRNGTATYKGSKSGISGLIDTQTDVQDDTWKDGFPVYSATAAEIDEFKDSDADGMPDWFEEKFGLNRFSGADANSKTLDKNGRYTNLEMFLHWLVKDITAAQNNSNQTL
mgnify:FL=1